MKHLQRFFIAGLLAAAACGGNAWARCSPIVIDLGNNGINLGEAGIGVYFDVNADGVRDHVQWVRRGGDEGFLALDRNGNGLVDDGGELFGVGTPLILEGRNAPNGFVGLAQYDCGNQGRRGRTGIGTFFRGPLPDVYPVCGSKRLESRKPGLQQLGPGWLSGSDF